MSEIIILSSENLERNYPLEALNAYIYLSDVKAIQRYSINKHRYILKENVLYYRTYKGLVYRRIQTREHPYRWYIVAVNDYLTNKYKLFKYI